MPSTLTPLEAITFLIEDQVAIARLRASYTLQLLYKLGRMTDAIQTQLKWDVDLAGGAAAIEAVTANGAATATDVVKNAVLPIGNYRIKHQFTISKIDMRQSAAIAPSELKNLFGNHVTRGITHILRTLNSLVYTGAGNAASAEVVGLEQVIDAAVSYGGISPITYPLWQAYVNANGGTARALTKNLMYDVDEATVNNETMYDFIVTSPRIGTKYKAAFDTTRPLEYLYTGEGELPNADLGLAGLSYNGKPIIQDPQCTAGSMYFLDATEIDIASFRVENGPDPTMGLDQTPIEVASTKLLGLNINVAELPSLNSAVRVFELYLLPQLRVRNRKTVSVIKDLITA